MIIIIIIIIIIIVVTAIIVVINHHLEMESRLVHIPVHVQICLLTIFHFASQFLYRYVEKNNFKV